MEKIIKKSSWVLLTITLLAFSFSVVDAQMPETIDSGIVTDAEIEEAIRSIDKDISDQEMAEVIKSGGWQAPDTSLDGNSANCFEYYKFQSVQISLDTDMREYENGSKASFSGYIINENEYPVVDGNIFVRISRKNDNYTKEGNFIIDEFIAVSDINLRENEKQEVSFSWQVPSSIKFGEYRADYFFSVGKKFNLGGLPFSNEIIIGTTSFSVSSDNSNFVSFDRSATKINGEEYRHIGDIPVFRPDENVNIEQSLENTYAEDKKVEITYDLYSWDSLNEEDKISTNTEEITIPANSTKEIRYIVEKLNNPVYYLKITAKIGDEKSIVNIRFASEINRPRLNYPAITKFPLKKGNNFTLFSCYHNMSSGSEQGRVDVKLFDKNNKEVASLKYEGDITSNMMATKEDIKASKDYDYLKLVADVYGKDGSIVDHYEIEYDCAKLNSCDNNNIESVNNAGSYSAIDIIKKILFAVLLIIVIATIVVVLINKRKK